ncbi:uncharacterized protein C8A04DRAFT_31213 [Dichotomopilus funicola]|uniref:Uncharacterized protein n=1 Tax=Dichotomopilus funicola TaxID=1934379 RepID=A0AAN6UYQ3_9PEZI|nr:hypothetical protein C8A04DRAFT_31213 [Dichotomopilus funicola]
MTTPQRLQTVRRVQMAMAVAYGGLGAWCLLHPASVIALGFTPPYVALAANNPTTDLFARCFGAQAMTCGLVLGTSQMTAFSFTAFGLAMVPYLAWNFWFSGVGPKAGMVSGLMVVDFFGNLGFLGGSLWCARVLREVEEDEDGKRK